MIKPHRATALWGFIMHICRKVQFDILFCCTSVNGGTFQQNNGLVFAVQLCLNSIWYNADGFCMAKIDIVKNGQIN